MPRLPGAPITKRRVQHKPHECLNPTSVSKQRCRDSCGLSSSFVGAPWVPREPKPSMSGLFGGYVGKEVIGSAKPMLIGSKVVSTAFIQRSLVAAVGTLLPLFQPNPDLAV